MHILSLETSTKIFSLAVSKDDQVLRFRNIRTERILESSMIPAIDKLLDSCGLNLQKIDAFAVGLGPGSFTSLRVGLSTVKAFAMATGKRVVGINSLDIIASGVIREKADEICVIVDARRRKVYAAIFQVRAQHAVPVQRKIDYLLTTIDDVLDRVHGATLFVGDGVGLYKNYIEKAYKSVVPECINRGPRTSRCPTKAFGHDSSGCHPIFALEKFWYPHAQELAKLAFQRLENKGQDDPAAIVPVYLYPADCQIDRP